MDTRRIRSVMEAITIRLREETIESLDDEASEHDVSRSEYVREVLDRRDEYDRLRDELERERARADDLQRQLAQANARDDDVTELVERVEEETSLLARERERERERESAGMVTRLKWWVFGRDLDD